jgi:hypothetical protein
VLDLVNPKLSFIIISSDKLDDVMSILWAKNYKVIILKKYYKGNYEDCVLSYSNIDNDELRSDCIFLLNHFKINFAIIKYLSDTDMKKINHDGSETPLSCDYYNTDDDKPTYIFNGVSFSFNEEKRYWKPTKKEDFKKGMIVEYLNNNKWYQQIVQDPLLEYEDLYKLLIKYDKIRVASI